ncbi:4-hydroxy-tetrahydrodipicolinate reductase [Sporolactobacillus sp. KGMB 08714]|uniref:4-hydroxy-tetrahydrodipicolinate reductase n=1 Tax=Sporolactobacillus sp. KGMB 08714 TaxID=3064704 RepID=UPI002FBD7DCC
MIRVALIGLGKTGKYLASGILNQRNMEIVAAICSPNSPKKGMRLGDLLKTKKTDVIISTSDDIESIIFQTRPDVVVDFSSPSSTMKNIAILSEMKTNMVIGTTGFSEEDINRIQDTCYRYKNGIVYAPNITLGVNVIMILSNIAAAILNNYDFQVVEMHYKDKKDSPSGTAIKISDEIEDGFTSSGLPPKIIPISAIRAGGVIGKHTVLAVGKHDRIEISHESSSRKVFAEGAIKAINFINHKTGYYEMKDVLNLKKILHEYNDKSSELASES